MDIAGKPLVAYSVVTAIESKLFDYVYVNSDDDEILAAAAKCGAVPYHRPMNFAGDKVFIIDVMKEMLDSLGISDDTTVGILLATSPLRMVEDIQEAYQIFCENNKNASVVSVTNFLTPIQLAQFQSSDGRLEPVFPDEYSNSTRSTGHKVAYKYNESIIFNNASNLRKQNNLIGQQPIPYIMPPERSFTIDYPYQFEMVRLLLNERNG